MLFSRLAAAGCLVDRHIVCVLKYYHYKIIVKITKQTEVIICR
jgi:hypothetical protein